MTTRYQESQIEDVAGIIAAELDDHPERPNRTPTLRAVARQFADLFAANTPPIMRLCWCSPECTDVRQVSGFNRTDFLAACGLESEVASPCSVCGWNPCRCCPTCGKFVIPCPNCSTEGEPIYCGNCGMSHTEPECEDRG